MTFDNYILLIPLLPLFSRQFLGAINQTTASCSVRGVTLPWRVDVETWQAPGLAKIERRFSVSGIYHSFGEEVQSKQTANER